MRRLITLFTSLLIFGCSISTDKNEQDQMDNQTEYEEVVIIKFKYGIIGLDSLNQLEIKLEQVINDYHLGEYDGHEIAVDYSDGFLFLYGPNAEKLFKAIKPILEETSFMKGAKVTLRFGPPVKGVKERKVEIE